MLEFYQAYATYDVLMDFTEVAPSRHRRAKLKAKMPDRPSRRGRTRGRTFTIDEPFARVPMDLKPSRAAR